MNLIKHFFIAIISIILVISTASADNLCDNTITCVDIPESELPKFKNESYDYLAELWLISRKNYKLLEKDSYHPLIDTEKLDKKLFLGSCYMNGNNEPFSAYFYFELIKYSNIKSGPIADNLYSSRSVSVISSDPEITFENMKIEDIQLLNEARINHHGRFIESTTPRFILQSSDKYKILTHGGYSSIYITYNYLVNSMEFTDTGHMQCYYFKVIDSE